MRRPPGMLWGVMAGLCLLANPAQAGEIRIDGAGALYPLNEAAAAGFRQTGEGKAIAMYVGAGGTGNGLSKFCEGQLDLAAASRPISRSESEACAKDGIEYVELPIAFDAVAVIVNARNTFVQSLSVEELRKIWEIAAQGRITRWNQINPAWPEMPLTLLAPDRHSDDASYFNHAVLGGKPAREDALFSDEDGVLMQGVRRSTYTLSYVSLGSYLSHRNQLRAISIASNGNPAVEPTVEAVQSGRYQPLTRPLFMYVSAKSLTRPEVVQYVDYLLAHVPELCKDRHCAVLNTAAYQRMGARVKSVTKGSLWEGKVPVGLTVNEIQKRYGLN